jgi:hypothetical protein
VYLCAPLAPYAKAARAKRWQLCECENPIDESTNQSTALCCFDEGIEPENGRPSIRNRYEEQPPRSDHSTKLREPGPIVIEVLEDASTADRIEAPVFERKGLDAGSAKDHSRAIGSCARGASRQFKHLRGGIHAANPMPPGGHRSREVPRTAACVKHERIRIKAEPVQRFENPLLAYGHERAVGFVVLRRIGGAVLVEEALHIPAMSHELSPKFHAILEEVALLGHGCGRRVESPRSPTKPRNPARDSSSIVCGWTTADSPAAAALPS